MDRTLTIFFTSDTHGYFAPVDYAAAAAAPTGLANCAANFVRDGNSLIIDGGDVLQGSPFTYWLQQCGSASGPFVPAKLMNLAGYQFVTLGNHDFNYGREVLARYLDGLDARCLCANIHGLPQVERTAVVTLENGLRVGLTGVTTSFIPVWEKPEHLTGVQVTDAVEAARGALEELRAAGVDLTVCIYHGGFENDIATGLPLSDTAENQAWRLCQELDFDVLLTGHQHMSLPAAHIRKTWTCQPPDKARSYIRMDVTVQGDGRIRAESDLLPAGDRTEPGMAAYLAEMHGEVSHWLDLPVGSLNTALMPDDHLHMAVHGSLIANFFNQVQLAASGADLSATCLGNEVRGFDRSVSIRDIVATYIYPNTLATIRVNREVLRRALERSAEYFDLDADGNLRVSDSFLHPKEEHYNFDYISGINVDIDISRPRGQRVLSIRRNGEELPSDLSLTLCLNNYRAAGSGGYEFYAACETVDDTPVEVVELIMDYITKHRKITVDKTRWLTVYNGDRQLS